MIKRSFQNVLTIVISLVFMADGGTTEYLPTAKENSESIVAASIIGEQAKSRMDDAMILLKRGKRDAAIYMLQQLEKDDPGNYDLLLKLGEIAIETKNWAYAIQVLRKASFLRAKDIDVRLLLMDIYKAYQMPVQEIIVAKEIIVLNPRHIIATQRLAELYQHQAMQKEEIKARQKIKKWVPEDYKNLKRLAEIFDNNGQHWEAAKVFEQIREYHPDQLDDMQRLAAIYGKLGEAFREADVLDSISENGGGYSWMQNRAEALLRKQNKVYDPVSGGMLYKTETEPTLEVDTFTSQLAYTRVRIRSSLDFGIAAQYTHLNHQGIGLLDGNMKFNNASFVVNATKHWLDNNLALDIAAGVSHDEISGKLFGRTSGVTVNDFPFLAAPSFKSFGGTIPIAKVQLTAKPWLYSIFDLTYEHNLVEELDARLSLFTFDRVSVAANYRANDKTELQAKIDNSFISDGNHRFHGLLSGYYTLWASTAKYDYRGRRKAFLHDKPRNFIRLGYEFEYFKDNKLAINEKYQTFVDAEFRHKGLLLGQAELYSFTSYQQILASIRLFYSGGTTLDYHRGVSARIFYYDPDFKNEIGISYSYEDLLSNNTTDANRRIAGLSNSHQISLNFKWHF